MSAPPTDAAITQVVRHHWGRILAVLVRQFGDFALAEDCLQDAVIRAMAHWPAGMPDAPDAWLLTTARRRAIDVMRRGQTAQQNSAAVALHMQQQQPDAQEDAMDIPDKRLEMLFTCCHPALDRKTQTALTLRTLGGLTAEEIAHAFLDKPATMAQRLSRARRKIKLAGIPYEIPDVASLPERQDSVMQVIYLIFNEGYTASHGDAVQRHDLMQEAIRLGRVLCELMPDVTEAAGLLALMLLHDARKAGRTDDAGQMIALEHQDRGRWDQAQIAAADMMLQNTLRRGALGPYQVQAAIAALHAQSVDWATTDWAQIAALYRLLEQIKPSPIVRLNHAVAVSYARGAEAGLVALDALAGTLDHYAHYHAARADVLSRLEQFSAAADCFQIAINLTQNAPDRAFLEAKAARLRLH